VEKARVCADRRRAAERVNMKKRRRVMIVSWRGERKTVNADVSEFNSIAGPRAELPDHALMRALAPLLARVLFLVSPSQASHL